MDTSFAVNESSTERVNVARFLRLRATEKPDSLAVRLPLPGRRKAGSEIPYDALSFSELASQADAASRYLQTRGVNRGMRVLLMVKPGRDLILCVFALFQLGAVPVVIDPGMGLKSFLNCVRRTKPEALVGIPLAHAVAVVARSAFKTVTVKIGVGTKPFVNGLQEHQGTEPFAIANTVATDLAAILFTSGSTGAPKGVCYEHGMFEAQVRLLQKTFQFEAGEVDLPMLPIFTLFNPAFGMATIVPEMNPSRPATVDPARIVQAIHQNEVTNSFGSPVLWRKVGDFCQSRNIKLPSLRRVLVAGAAVAPTVIRTLREVIPNGEVYTPYGATECLPLTVMAGREILEETWQQTEHGKGMCVGKPVSEISLRIIPRQDGPRSWVEGEAMRPGELGEIVASGPVVTKRYDQLTEATAKAKMTDPDGVIWHRMGDLGYLDETGRLWFAGRDAERVETATGLLCAEFVEARFNLHPLVARTALIGLGARPKQEPALVVELKTGAARKKSERQKLVNELRSMAKVFPELLAIEKFFFCKAFPVDVRHNAKVHRLTLTKRYQAKPKLAWQANDEKLNYI